MKAVLISIQPKWCEKIASGEKTIEVRKTRPKIETPFKCYIYETKNKKYKNMGVMGYRKDGTSYNFVNHIGKVIGEFVCDRIDKFAGRWFGDYKIPFGTEAMVLRESCLTLDELTNYLMLKNGYAWHISDLKIYDKPKELSEFLTICKYDTVFSYNSKCEECPYFDKNLQNKTGSVVVGLCSNGGYIPITRVPQSWCYVEENEDER